MKKILVVFISAMLVLSSLCVLPVAAEANVWDGVTVSTSLEGAGTAESPYLIATGADLALVRQEINAGNVLYSAANYKQTADIDLNGYCVDPIGPTKDAGMFLNGVYDGDGHTISNYVVNSAFKYAGLFGYVAGSYIENVKVAKAYVSSSSPESSSAVGALVGYIDASSEVTGCSTAADCYVESINVARVGGLVGWNYSSLIKNCLNRATAVYAGTNAAYIGGITGTTGKDGALVENCINLGTVVVQAAGANSKALVGGVIGIAGGSSGTNETKNCYNAGTVACIYEFAAKDVGLGGISGNNNKGQNTVTNCYNVGSLYATSGTYNPDANFIGSITGYAPTETVEASGCVGLAQDSIPAIAKPACDGMTLTSDGASIKDAIAAIDAAVAAALGVECNWAIASYDNTTGEADATAAIAFQESVLVILDSAPQQGEAKGDTPAETDPVETEPTETEPTETEPTETEPTETEPTETEPTETEPTETTPAGGDDPKEPAGGCGSAIGTGFVAVALVSIFGMAYVAKRK